MFTRRLLLLMGLMALSVTLLAGQLANLTLLHGEEKLSEAESVLVTRTLVNTRRGTILDRRGRVLAEDQPCLDIALNFNLITESWAYQRARDDAYREHRRQWGELSFDEREQRVKLYIDHYEQKMAALWALVLEAGNIPQAELDHRRQTIIQRVSAKRAAVWSRIVERRSKQLNREVELSEVAAPVRAELTPHTILEAVRPEVAHRFSQLARAMPGVHVIKSSTRVYPLRRVTVELKGEGLPKAMKALRAPMKIEVGPVAGHALGRMQEVKAEHIQERPFWRKNNEPDRGGYLPGDTAGLWGVEEAEEVILRGLRGQKIHQRDTDTDRYDDDAQPGGDVKMTLDAMLQARIEAIVHPSYGLTVRQSWHGDEQTPNGTKLNGAVVVLDVDSGDVLSMVSWPPMPEEDRPGQAASTNQAEVDSSIYNRAIGVATAPGSTVKPLVYCIAAATGNISPNRVFNCKGHLLEHDTDSLRCWIYKRFQQGHGELGPAEAIARSCNIYFYECGRLLNAGPLVKGFQDWGFGQFTGIGLRGESEGIMPSLDGNNPPGRSLSLQNAIQMGIGQGPIAVPPVQVAAAHAALARGGYYLSPVLMETRRNQQREMDLRLPPATVSNALKGMFDSANAAYGTGHHLPGAEQEPILNCPGAVVRAKTGTASAPTQFLDANNNGKQDEGERILRQGDHSWFICHVQKPGAERASYIVCVLVEYGGAGGKVAGPIANQVIWALKAEGYL